MLRFLLRRGFELHVEARAEYRAAPRLRCLDELVDEELLLLLLLDEELELTRDRDRERRRGSSCLDDDMLPNLRDVLVCLLTFTQNTQNSDVSVK